MRCPRCHLETGDPAPAFCRGCGAPLRLSDEPAPRPVDAPLPLDRRGDLRDRAGARAPAPAAAPGLLDAPLPIDRRGARAEAPPAPPPLGPPASAARGELADLERSHWDLGAALARADRRGAPAVHPLAEAAAAPAPPRPVEDDALPEPEVDALEIRLRRPDAWRRAAAAAIDVGPFAAGGVALLASLLGDGPGGVAAVRGIGDLLDLVARERVIVLSVAAALTLAVAVYATLAHGLAGATLGKRLLGLAVVGPDGRLPSLGRSAARSALAVASAALLGLGLLLPLFTRSGRALHDYAARTWVVDAARRAPAS